MTVYSWKKAFECDLEHIVLELKGLIKPPSVLILTGEVGSGKTTLTQEFARHVMPSLKVNSPTYSTVNEIGPLLHVDFYRIEKVKEITHLELSYCLENKSWCFVEWGKRWLNAIYREFPSDFNYYEMEILVNPPKRNVSSRNYFLQKLDSHGDS